MRTFKAPPLPVIIQMWRERLAILPGDPPVGREEVEAVLAALESQ